MITFTHRILSFATQIYDVFRKPLSWLPFYRTTMIQNILINQDGYRPDLRDNFYFEITNLNIEDSNTYFNFITKINSENQTVNTSPAFKTIERDVLLGMTDKFYVKLKSVDDYELLKKSTNNFDITILGHFENMALWYILRLPKGSKKQLCIGQIIFTKLNYLKVLNLNLPIII